MLQVSKFHIYRSDRLLNFLDVKNVLFKSKQYMFDKGLVKECPKRS